MSFGIIVRNSSKHFKRHYNMALGKEIYTRGEYLSEMKRQGCQPYDPSSVKQIKRNKYSPSKWAREMASEIDRRRMDDGTFEMSTSMRESIISHQKENVKIPERIDFDKLDIKKGGFCASDKKRP